MTESINILIIDDNPDDCEAYVRALKKVPDANYRYSSASDGRSGLVQLVKQTFDCVLLDYSLPGMNGLDVLRDIREHHPYMPVVLLTGQGNESIAVEAIKQGAHDYLTKSSVNPERLHFTIRTAIHQGVLRRELIEKDTYIRRQTEELAQSVIELEAIKQQQEQLIAKLTESNSELERFAYVCTHDLQEPLRMISNYTQRLEMHLGKLLDERGRHYMLYITDGAAHARKLIHDVLDYSHVDQQTNPLEIVSGDEILWNVLRDLGERVAETGATITHDKFPWLEIEPTHLRQILQNLISNALKFNEDLPEIHISVERDDAFWRFGVRDNGIGIAPEHQKKIFEIFQRLNTRDVYPGSGIGLALCKKLVSRYGGNIWVESEPGKGSTFYFRLPAKMSSMRDVA